MRDIPLTPEILEALVALVESAPTTSPSVHLTTDEVEAYEEGTADDHGRRRIDEHLATCEPCARVLELHFRAAQAWEGPSGAKRLDSLDERLNLLLTDAERRAATRAAGPLGVVAPALVPQPTSSAGGKELAISPTATATEHTVELLLSQAGAIQRGSDYILPSGLHCDTHIDVSLICRSERLLEAMAAALAPLLADVKFDTVVSAGWTMATLARRLFPRSRDRRGIEMRLITAEGYDPPLLLEACPRGNRVLLLLDVVVTGALVSRLKAQVEARGARVVQAAALVDAGHVRAPLSIGLRSLCRIQMNVQAAVECVRHDTMPVAQWNPISCRMTRRREQPQSPSDFLSQDAAARELWTLVDMAAAYEHHHREGDRHYLGFLNTHRLLTHRKTQGVLVGRFRDVVLARLGAPEVLLVPRRARALLLAELLAVELKDRVAPVRVVSAARRHGHFSFTPATARAVRGRRVLVADTAIGHGNTLDELVLLTRAEGASHVAAAAILSRLAEGAEEALAARLDGSFVRLYGVPVRPFTVPASVAVWGCPFCARKNELRKAARGSGLLALRQLERQLGAVGFHRTPSSDRRPQQLTFPTIIRPLLERCRRSVAGGVALHALHTAIGDGMAPLSVRELLDDRVPLANRVAMLEDLPVGVVRWSGEPLVGELRTVLSKTTKESLWLAAVEALTREGSVEWIDHLNGMLVRNEDRLISPRFWCQLSYATYRLGRGSGGAAEHLRCTLRELIKSHGRTPARSGLKSMLDATSDRTAAEIAG